MQFEIATHFWRKQMRYAFDLPDIRASREYFDTFQLHAPVFDRIRIRADADAGVQGRWFEPVRPSGTMLYLHGGGYAYYAKAHDHLISLVTDAAQTTTFAPDYRLTPEHAYPAQLEDALTAYCWLLGRGVNPAEFAVAGDSAGGNLVLCLLRAIKKNTLPMPAAAVCISPWTDVSNSGASLTANEAFDFVEKRMAVRWAEWLTREHDPTDPDISPLYADSAGFPPIYIQAGGAEILVDMIRAYAEKAAREGANVKLDVWEYMNHDFQSFGDQTPESREALRRIGEYVGNALGRRGYELRNGC